jgi:hypothetical protein
VTVAQLKTRRRGPEVLAEANGPCKGCDKRIVADEDYISIVDGVGTMHALCAKNYCEILKEYAEEGDE